MLKTQPEQGRPQIDVIMTLFNGAKWIAAALDSVMAQTVTPQNIMVVDDGSSDDSAEIVKKYPSVQLLRNPGKGVAAGRNHGLAHAKSEFIAYLDQDDVWHPRHLELLSTGLRQNPDIGGIISDYQIFQDGKTPHLNVDHPEYHKVDVLDSYPVFTGQFITSACMYRREALNLAGGWDSRGIGAGDYFLWAKVSAHAPMLKCKVRSMGYRIHADSMLQKWERQGKKVMVQNLFVSDLVLDYHLSLVKDHQKRFFLKKRNLLNYQLFEVFDRLTEGDLTALSARLMDLEHGLKDESDAFIRHMARQIDYYILRFAKDPQEVYEYYKTLIRHTPARAKKMADILDNLLVHKFPGMNFYLKSLSEDPFNYKIYVPVVMAVKFKLRGDQPGIKLNV